jgi:sulfatase modifying factor 1
MSGIITVNAGAQVYLPSENEWYKAAYYNGNSASYSLYPNGQNTITTADANFSGSASTDVGSYSSGQSFYGTFDQGGNVWEWDDTVIGGSLRSIRGGSWGSDEYFMSSSSARTAPEPTFESEAIGFRIASVPEPTSLVLTMLTGGLMIIRRNR